MSFVSVCVAVILCMLVVKPPMAVGETVAPVARPVYEGSSRLYYVHHDRRSGLMWNKANEYCQDNFHNGQLAEIWNQDAQDLISLILSAQGIMNGLFWIGLNDRATEGAPMWHSSDPMEFVGDWLKGDVNNDKKRDCVLLRVKHDIIYWMFDRCNYRRSFICEYFSGPDQCGSPSVALPRIVGGRSAHPGMWPWQVSVVYNGGHVCGGVLLDNQWILTAAQCVFDDENEKLLTLEKFTARLGAVTLSDGSVPTGTGSPNELSSAVDIIQTHPFFRSDSGFRRWDFALMHMSQPVTLTDYIKPVCISTSNDFPEGAEDDCFISGWSTTSTTGTMSDVLQYSKVDLVDNAQCHEDHFGAIYDFHICTANNGTVGTCYGNAGTPLVCQSAGKWYLAGINSWRRGDCADADFPSVFSRLTSALPWILKKLNAH